MRPVELSCEATGSLLGSLMGAAAVMLSRRALASSGMPWIEAPFTMTAEESIVDPGGARGASAADVLAGGKSFCKLSAA